VGGLEYVRSVKIWKHKKIYTVIFKAKHSVGKTPSFILENIIKMDLKDIGYNCLDYVEMGDSRDISIKVMNL
jgi:hypothetical protein